MPNVTYFPSVPGVPVVPESKTLTSTLAAGSSSINFNDAFIENTLIDKKYEVFTDKDDLNFEDIYVTGTSCTIDFAPQVTDTIIKLKITAL